MISLLLGLALAGPVEDGAAAFAAGDIDAAIAAWQAVEGAPSATVHYDLGVAWYRKGDLPRAIGHWRAAHQLSPRDGETSHNLALARSRVAGAPPPPVPPAVGWLDVFTVGEVGVLGALLLALASGLAVRGRREVGRGGAPTLGGPPALGAAVAGALLGGAALYAHARSEAHPVAVVVDAPAAARDAASVEGTVRLELAPGSELIVERALGDFLLVRTSRDESGWVPRASVMLVGAGAST